LARDRSARTLALPRTDLLPDLARPQGALQADGVRRRLGSIAALRDDGGLLCRLRLLYCGAFPRCPISGFFVYRVAALDLLRDVRDPGRKQPHSGPEPDLEGVLPSHSNAVGRRIRDA